MVRFQLSHLILFGLRKYYHMRVVDLHLLKLIEGDISVIYDRFSSIKYLSITKDFLMLNFKHLVSFYQIVNF